MFDSGGLSIKTAGGMETMKTDMSGGAAVIAAMSALRDLGVKTRVIGFVPLVENMPSGNAMRPGDVLTMRNGKTVEVLNTDAEGRLILADALSLASEEKPDAIVDLATLTGACVVALGDKVAGLMGTDDAWIEQVRAAADRVGRAGVAAPVARRVPQAARLRGRRPASNIAQRRRRRRAHGGAVPQGVRGDVPWAHLDIAGPARASAATTATSSRGGTGFGVRTLVELARTFKAPKRVDVTRRTGRPAANQPRSFRSARRGGCCRCRARGARRRPTTHHVEAARRRALPVLADLVELGVVARTLEPLRRFAPRNPATQMGAALVEDEESRFEHRERVLRIDTPRRNDSVRGELDDVGTGFGDVPRLGEASRGRGAGRRRSRRRCDRRTIRRSK